MLDCIAREIGLQSNQVIDSNWAAIGLVAIF